MQHPADTRTGEVATYLTIPQAARIVGVSPDTIRRRILSGELPAAMFAKKNPTRPADLEALVTGRAVA